MLVCKAMDLRCRYGTQNARTDCLHSTIHPIPSLPGRVRVRGRLLASAATEVHVPARLAPGRTLEGRPAHARTTEEARRLTPFLPHPPRTSFLGLHVLSVKSPYTSVNDPRLITSLHSNTAS